MLPNRASLRETIPYPITALCFVTIQKGSIAIMVSKTEIS